MTAAAAVLVLTITLATQWNAIRARKVVFVLQIMQSMKANASQSTSVQSLTQTGRILHPP